VTIPIPIHANAQIVETINNVQIAAMSDQVVKTSGAGKAYQSVAQTAAIAVQDAADGLRNMSTLSTTATGVALAQMLACASTGQSTTPYEAALGKAHEAMDHATSDFRSIGKAAAEILRGFPSGG
jgi:hypothetical protein